MIPFEHPELYSKLIFPSMASPGVVTLSGHDRSWTWNTTAAKGTTGASSTLEGEAIGEPQASFYLASDQDFADWEVFAAMLFAANKAKPPTALPVFHPDLARNLYTDISIQSVGALVHDSQGGATVLVKFIEYRPPKPKPAQKASSKADTNSTQTTEKPNPLADAEQELNDLLDEAGAP